MTVDESDNFLLIRLNGKVIHKGHKITFRRRKRERERWGWWNWIEYHFAIQPDEVYLNSEIELEIIAFISFSSLLVVRHQQICHKVLPQSSTTTVKSTSTMTIYAEKNRGEKQETIKPRTLKKINLQHLTESTTTVTIATKTRDKMFKQLDHPTIIRNSSNIQNI